MGCGSNRTSYPRGVRAIWIPLLLVSCTRGTEPEFPAIPDDSALDADVEATTEASIDAADATVDVAEDTVDSDSAESTALDAAPAPTLLATFTAGPRDVAAGGGYVFVTTFGGEILRIPRDGGAPVKLASPDWPTYLSVDTTHVYWTDLRKLASDPGKIGRVPIGGGPEEILATNLDRPNSCALAAGRVFFAQFTAVSAVPRTGGVVDSVAATESAPYYVATSSTLVCWVRMPTTIVCKPQTGGAISVLATEASGTIYALAIDDTRAFWAMRDGSLRTVPLSGGTPTTLAAPLDDCPFGADIELDATRAYWACGPNVRSVAKTGGAVTALHHATNPVMGIAVDESRVYWTTNNELTLRSLPK